ncbi:hypothetical protein KR059_010595, partial [Drosophila kikkawai]
MCDYVFKILIVGDLGVGKSCLFWRFVDDRFTLIYYPTAGIEFKYCHVEVAGKKVLLQIWDAAGEERFRPLLQNYYRNSHGIIIVYDTTSLLSFRHVSYWLKELGEFCCKKINVMLVGSKCDELEERQVTLEKGVRYAEHYGLSFIEASAKSGANVKDAFDILAVQIYSRLVLKLAPSPTTRSEKVVKGDRRDKSG